MKNFSAVPVICLQLGYKRIFLIIFNLLLVMVKGKKCKSTQQAVVNDSFFILRAGRYEHEWPWKWRKSWNDVWLWQDWLLIFAIIYPIEYSIQTSKVCSEKFQKFSLFEDMHDKMAIHFVKIEFLSTIDSLKMLRHVIQKSILFEVWSHITMAASQCVSMSGNTNSFWIGTLIMFVITLR